MVTPSKHAAHTPDVTVLDSLSNMGARPDLRPARLRFGAFELNVETGELSKHGVRLRVQDQPLRLLLALLETPGAVCFREDLIRLLWAEGTFVDFDHGLNAAITRLRQVLADSANDPRYVETVGRKGYRFIAPVELVAAPTKITPEAPATPISGQPVVEASGARLRRTSSWVSAVVIAVVASAGSILWLRTNRSTPKPLIRLNVELPPDMTAESTGPGTMLALSPDGLRLAITVRSSDGKRRLATRRLEQGQVVVLQETEGAGAPFFSPDGQWIGFSLALASSEGQKKTSGSIPRAERFFTAR